MTTASAPPPAPPPDVLELYKLAVEMADRVSARRGTANAFFLSVQTTLVAVVGFGAPWLAPSAWWTVAAVTAAGLTLSTAWWLQLRSYRDLNAAKFKVINELEGLLPVKVFTAEWDHLKQDPPPVGRVHYAELGISERFVPWVFAAIHLLVLLGTMLK
ncbi:RipA family octameric membrane protein [Kitasatospora griseola]|uniref:RipA family octameric membrane protein n=1 Tax=Kitasatospora griseola TaxID=2064 RepID=UPI003806A99D